MKKNTRLWKATAIIYILAFACFMLFFGYMAFFENVSVETTRVPTAKRTISNVSFETVKDENLPAGVKKIYHFPMDDDIEECSIFSFYTVHHYADVYYGDELVYSLKADENNRVGKSVSSNWVIVPIHREDIGKDVKVVLTPLFSSVIDQDVQFFLGSYYSVIYSQLEKDFPQLFLSLLCIFLGLVIISVYFYFAWRKKISNRDIYFLGIFAFVLGLWRITDTLSSSLIFSENTMALGYITIGSLFLCCTPLLLLMSSRYSRKKQAVLLTLSMAISLISLAVLILQWLSVWEFKQMLIVSHIMMISGVLIVGVISIISHIDKTAPGFQKTGKYFAIIALGVFLDILSFYITKSSSGVMFTIIAFIGYALTVFLKDFVATYERAHLDARTGLSNKSAWNDIVSSHAPKADETGFIMIDMNALKWVNDNFGHEVGDRIIFNFANILKSVFPSSCTLSLWGGDEFAIMTLNMKKDKIEFYLAQLKAQVEKHNQSTSDPPISFSAGYVLSTEFKDKDTSALIAIADKRMYENKDQWYEQNPEMKKVRRMV